MWSLSDESLLAGLASGDPESAAALLRRFQARVFGLALTIVGDRESAREWHRKPSSALGDMRRCLGRPSGGAQIAVRHPCTTRPCPGLTALMITAVATR